MGTIFPLEEIMLGHHNGVMVCAYGFEVKGQISHLWELPVLLWVFFLAPHSKKKKKCKCSFGFLENLKQGWAIEKSKCKKKIHKSMGAEQKECRGRLEL